MANRSIKVILSANVQDFKAQIRSSQKSLEDLVKSADQNATVASTKMGKMAQSIESQREAWTTAGVAVTGFGALATAAFAGSSKAAIDWESAFAGVKKTVDGTPEELGLVNGQLRELAKSLPASHAEIAGVAEAAGQLGIKREDIASFTKVMIDMGESTNLSADEAASALAKFSNISGTSSSEVGKLGSAIVALGNNFATTERDILEMAMRLVSAGTQAGFTEGEVLGLATAMSSVGINAEAGGSAMSRVLVDMGRAVDQGGAKLEILAQTAGMTTEQFQKAFKQNAGEALAAFISGLGDMQSKGQSITPILDGLKWKSVQIGNALRASASNSELFTDAMNKGNEAFAEGTALQNEANQRYETTAAKLDILKNNFVDIGISIGSAFLPVLNAILTPIADFLGFISNLPGPIQGLLGGIMGLSGAVGLLAGGFLLLAPRILDSYKAFQELKALNLAGSLHGVATAATVAGTAMKLAFISSGIGIAIAALSTAIAYFTGGSEEARQRQEELAASLDQTTGAMTEQTLQALAAREDLQALAKEYSEAGGNAADFWRAQVGDKRAQKNMQELADSLRGSNEELVVMGRHYSSINSDNIDHILDATKATNSEIAASVEQWKNQKDAVEVMTESSGKGVDALSEMADAAGFAADGMETAGTSGEYFEGVMDDLADSTEQAYQDLYELLEVMNEFAETNMKADEALMKYDETLQESIGLLEEKAYREADAAGKQRLMQQALIDTARAGHDVIESMVKQGASAEDLQAKKRQLIDQFFKLQQQFGITGDKAVELAARYGLIPDHIKTEAQFNDWVAKGGIDSFIQQLAKIPSKKQIIIEQTFTQTGKQVVGGLVQARANGGLIRGPGTSTSDSIPARLSNGEYVVRASAVKTYGVGFLEAINSMVLPKFANGGLVSAQAVKPPAVNVSAPSLEGLAIQGSLKVGDAIIPLVDARIAKNPAVQAVNGFMNNAHYSRMIGG